MPSPINNDVCLSSVSVWEAMIKSSAIDVPDDLAASAQFERCRSRAHAEPSGLRCITETLTGC